MDLRQKLPVLGRVEGTVHPVMGEIHISLDGVRGLFRRIVPNQFNAPIRGGVNQGRRIGRYRNAPMHILIRRGRMRRVRVLGTRIVRFVGGFQHLPQALHPLAAPPVVVRPAVESLTNTHNPHELEGVSVSQLIRTHCVQEAVVKLGGTQVVRVRRVPVASSGRVPAHQIVIHIHIRGRVTFPVPPLVGPGAHDAAIVA